jgi:hypothetical protein
MTIQTAPPSHAPPGSAEAAGQAGHITPWQTCYRSTQLISITLYTLMASPFRGCQGGRWLAWRLAPCPASSS